MTEKCGIYRIYNNINDKLYIGKTTQGIETRFYQHKKSASLNNKNNKVKSKLFYAINKYGENNFFIEWIEVLEEEKLNDREVYWIKYYDSYKNGYNSTIGGDGLSGKDNPMYGVRRYGKDNPFFGKKHTEEVKKMISENAKNRKGIKYNINKDERKRRSESLKEWNKNNAGKTWKGRKHKKETIEKLRNIHCKKIICLDTNIEYISSEDAARKLNLKCPELIGRSIKKGGKAYGKKWAYI